MLAHSHISSIFEVTTTPGGRLYSPPATLLVMFICHNVIPPLSPIIINKHYHVSMSIYKIGNIIRGVFAGRCWPLLLTFVGQAMTSVICMSNMCVGVSCVLAMCWP